MRHKVKIALLALGVVLGYGSGIASFSRCSAARRGAWERHVAKVCVDAAKAPPAADAP
jgi:hypothetical protein